MKLLFLSKRSPQQRDLLTRPYGRFFHLPRALAAAGHEVRLALLSHRGEDAVSMARDGLHWSSHDLGGARSPSALRQLAADACAFRPDWVIGCSDAWVSVLAAWLAGRCGGRLALDAYDDYSAYMPWNLPLHALYRRSLRRARLVTAAGPQLAGHLARQRGSSNAVHVLPMVADPEFKPLDRSECRARLGLPASAPLLGYYGGWGRARGTELLLPAFRRVRAARPDVQLALTGRPPAGVLDEPGVIGLGYLDDEALPAFVNAIDVSAVITADTRFGRGSYPAKLCEAMACGVPVVATETEPVRWMLGEGSEALVPVGDEAAFAARVLAMLPVGRRDHGPRGHWDGLARQWAAWLEAEARS
jgi:glycosyltransferase involved in cell wall biosynthesis